MSGNGTSGSPLVVSGSGSSNQTLSLSNTDVLSISSGNSVTIGYPDYQSQRSLSNTTGAFEISIPNSYWYGSIFMVIKVMNHNGIMVTYEINGYCNNPNGWVNYTITKSGPVAYQQNVRLAQNGITDYKIYIGDLTQSQFLKKIFITEFYAMGISNSIHNVVKNLHNIPIQLISTSFTGTIKYTQ